MNAWLNEVANSDNTKHNYTRDIQRFLEFFDTTLEEIAKEYDNIETYAEDRKFKRKWKKKLKIYKNALANNEELTELTIETYVIPINSFMKWYDIPIRIKTRKADVTYHNRDITKEEIDDIITNVPQIRDKAFYSFMKDSGLRPITLAQLQYIDLKEDWESNTIPCKINVPKHKNKGSYKKHYTFIGYETVEYLRKYWDKRYSKDTNPNDNDLVFSQNDIENTPINTISENNIFCRVALRLDIAEKRDEKGKPKSITQYTLKKFFRNNLPNAPEVDSVDVHFFMGHKLGTNDEHYFSAENIEKFRKKYEKGYKHIAIREVPKAFNEVVKHIEGKLERTEKRLLKAQSILDRYEKLIPIDELEHIENLGDSIPTILANIQKDVANLKKGVS